MNTRTISVDFRSYTQRIRLYRAWAARQKYVEYGSAGEYIGAMTILSMGGNSVSLHARSKTSVRKFIAEARALKLL